MRLLKLAILAAAAYFAYDYLVVQEHWRDWKLPEPAKPPAGQTFKPEDMQRSPGRGLNPFVLDDMPGSGPKRPPMPSIPGAPAEN